MSWKIIDQCRNRLATEEGAITKGWGGKISICLVYPNHYRTGMSNLGFQSVYAFLNSQHDVVCERAFLPDSAEQAEYALTRTALLSLETQRPLPDFDVIAFSVSFETDFLNIPKLLTLARIPVFSAERDNGQPLVIAGGAALFLNPEPVADFLDLVCIGEGEPLIPALLELLRSTAGIERDRLLDLAATVPGFYVPALYTINYCGDSITGILPKDGVPQTIRRIWADNLDSIPVGSQLFSPDSEFADMYLLEISRGCPRGCRFCAASFIYAPYRQRSLESVKKQVCEVVGQHGKIGLVGAAVGDFKGIGELCSAIKNCGGDVSVASLRIDALDDEMIRVLAESGHKTISLAPEGPSQRLRNLIRKGISTQQILDAARRLTSHGILNLKLYYIIGLPTETAADLEEMIELVEDVRKLVASTAKANRRLGQLILSVNPFVPKPFTPFQWCGMFPGKELERKVHFLHKAFACKPNVRLQVEGLKDARLQALLARGDRRLSRVISAAADTGGLRRALKEAALDLERMVCRAIPLEEILPWDIIGSENREQLKDEYRRAFDD